MARDAVARGRITWSAAAKKEKAVPCGTAKFREETSKKQRAEASLRCTIYGRHRINATCFLQCSKAGKRAKAPIFNLKCILVLSPQPPLMSPYVALAVASASVTLILRLAWAAPLVTAPQRFIGETRPARPVAADIDPSQLCRAAIAATERTTRIPDEFLSAIGRVESGRMGGGRLNPWPWTVNAAGAGHFYPTKQAAEEAVRQFQASGVKSLDVGCLQVNLFYHPGAFPSLDQAFDPASNAAFAAGMLMDLFQTTGSWPRAAAAYHSMTPALGEAYQQKVLDAWSTPDRLSAPAAATPREIPPTGPSLGTEAEPVTSAPARAGSFGTAPPPPELGFSRRLMRAPGPAAGGSAGRSLASYRSAPVQIAQRPAMGPPTLAR